MIEPYHYQKTTNVKEHNDIINKMNEVIGAVNAGVTVDAYTKAETDNLLAGKQKKLIAGTGISLDENGNISATGQIDAYTKAETDNLLAGKQKKLIAGTGISLDENGNISATGQIDAYTKQEVNNLLLDKQKKLTPGSGINLDASGNISVNVPTMGVYTKSETDNLLAGKQKKLIAGTGISLDENGNISATGQIDAYTKSETDSLLANKQNKLTSGVNIKTVNGNSLLGSGNIDIETTGGITTIQQQGPDSNGDVRIAFSLSGNSEPQMEIGQVPLRLPLWMPEAGNVTINDGNTDTVQWFYVENGQRVNITDFNNIPDNVGIGATVQFSRHYSSTPYVLVTGIDVGENFDDGDYMYIRNHSSTSFTVYCGNTGYDGFNYLVIPRS